MVKIGVYTAGKSDFMLLMGSDDTSIMSVWKEKSSNVASWLFERKALCISFECQFLMVPGYKTHAHSFE